MKLETIKFLIEFFNVSEDFYTPLTDSEILEISDYYVNLDEKYSKSGIPKNIYYNWYRLIDEMLTRDLPDQIPFNLETYLEENSVTYCCEDGIYPAIKIAA